MANEERIEHLNDLWAQTITKITALKAANLVASGRDGQIAKIDAVRENYELIGRCKAELRELTGQTIVQQHLAGPAVRR